MVGSVVHTLSESLHADYADPPAHWLNPIEARVHFIVASEKLPLTRVAHDDLVVFLQQSFVKTFLRGVVGKCYALLAGVLVRYRKYYTSYVHTIFLHAVRPVAKRIIV